MIATLATTIIVESTLVAAFAVWRRKPLKHLLLSSLCANLLTQSLLWAGLIVFPRFYFLTLSILELCIWGLEAAFLYLYRYNRLNLQEAVLLSLVMNMASFGIGCLLPV